MSTQEERANVYCRGCGAWLGRQAWNASDPLQEWKCSICFTVTRLGDRGPKFWREYRAQREQARQDKV